MYLGSIIDEQGGTEADVKARIGNAFLNYVANFTDYDNKLHSAHIQWLTTFAPPMITRTLNPLLFLRH